MEKRKKRVLSSNDGEPRTKKKWGKRGGSVLRNQKEEMP